MADTSKELVLSETRNDLRDCEESNNDTRDFSSKFIIYDEEKNELTAIRLNQRQMMMLFVGLLAAFFFVLVAFGAIEVKDLVEIKKLVEEIRDSTR